MNWLSFPFLTIIVDILRNRKMKRKASTQIDVKKPAKKRSKNGKSLSLFPKTFPHLAAHS